MRLAWVFIFLSTGRCHATECPKTCTCDEFEGTSASLQVAHCSGVPTEPLPSFIASIKVNTTLQSVTRELMSSIGSHVQSLDLSNCGIVHIEPGAFENLKSLLILHLSGNNIKEVPADTFGTTSTIRTLYLDRNNLNDCDKTNFKNMSNLQELHLQGNSLSCIPTSLPAKLRMLDVSSNNITQNITILQQGSLRHLYLCDNPYSYVDVNRSDFSNLKSLCLGNHLEMLPQGLANWLPDLHNFSLIAEPQTNATLDNQTQWEIGSMSQLDTLTIAHYGTESLDFLKNLTKIKILRLQFVGVEKEINVDQLFSNMLHCSQLFLDGSAELAQAILNSVPATQSLRELHLLGLRKTGIQYYLPIHVPYRSYFKLDISDNPIHCDCRLLQLQAALDTDLSHHLYQPEHTLCDQPSAAHGHPILQYMKHLHCPTTTSPTPNLAMETVPAPSTSGNRTTLYIVLGVLLVILVVAGSILGFIYRVYKRRNKVYPGEEPTFQQLQQARSDDALLTN